MTDIFLINLLLLKDKINQLNPLLLLCKSNLYTRKLLHPTLQVFIPYLNGLRIKEIKLSNSACGIKKVDFNYLFLHAAAF